MRVEIRSSGDRREVFGPAFALLGVALSLGLAGCGPSGQGSIKVNGSPDDVRKDILSPPGIRVASPPSAKAVAGDAARAQPGR